MEDTDLTIVLARQTDQTVTATMRLTVPGSNVPAILADRIPIVVDQSSLLELYLDADAYGRHLSAMLFAGACLGGALRRARDVAKQTGRHLRLRLCLDPTDDTLAGIRWETLRDPEGAIQSVLKRNPIAKRDVELERLRLSLERNFVSPDVRKNGLGAVDMKRLERSIEQIGLTFTYTNKPRPADIFTAQFLPPREQRLVK